MRIKKGVRVLGLKNEMLLALMIVEPILEKHGQELVLTSGHEGKHSKKSRHYIGYGSDIRTRDLPQSQIPEIVNEMKDALGSEYYVVFEGNHIHMQFNGTMVE